MARIARAAYKDQVETRYPDNGTGDITPQDDRDDKVDNSDSSVWWADEVVTDMSDPNDETVPTTSAVADAILNDSGHDRGPWNTNDAVPDDGDGSGDDGEIVKHDKWYVPYGETWTYGDTSYGEYTCIEAMIDNAVNFRDFKKY